LNGLTENISTLVQVEQEIVFNFDRVNFVLDGPSVTNGYDGKLDKKNIAIIYKTTGTTENGENTYVGLGTDTSTLSTNINSFLTSLTQTGLYVGSSYLKSSGSYEPPTSDTITNSLLLNADSKLEFMMMSKALLEEQSKQKFIDDLKIGLDQVTANAVDFYYNGLGNTNSRYNVWKKVKDSNKEILTSYRTGSVGLIYEDYKPIFGTNKVRNVLFSTDVLAPAQTKKTLQNIYSGKNNNAQNNPYNFKRSFN
jgi:hypothetical protein